MSGPQVWPWLPAGDLVNGVYHLCEASAFEEKYRAVRAAEERLLSDTRVRQLPDGTSLWNASEWRIRSRSAERLCRQLARQGPGLQVLEVGCGNGWLSALLHRKGHKVLGIDPFTAELEQAARVFPGPTFARADLFTSPLPKATFDAIVFAASIQYFADPDAVVQRALELLRSNGVVHVLDTVLYANAAAAVAAKGRSIAYFTGMDAAPMADHYHAHQIDAFRRSGELRVVHAPSPFDRIRRLFGLDTSPFTHMEIRHRSA